MNRSLVVAFPAIGAATATAGEVKLLPERSFARLGVRRVRHGQINAPNGGDGPPPGSGPPGHRGRSHWRVGHSLWRPDAVRTT